MGGTYRSARLPKKEEEEKKKVEDLLSPRHPHPCVVAARGRFFSRVGRKIEA
ncbi:hypothetical protein BHM03_00038998, partial [Ensete ventricosum]